MGTKRVLSLLFVIQIGLLDASCLEKFNRIYESAFVMAQYECEGKSYVLLGEEAHGNYKGLWSFFGGGREPYEHQVYQTAAREFCEESNVDMMVPTITIAGLTRLWGDLGVAGSTLERLLLHKRSRSGLIMVRLPYEQVIAPILKRFEVVRRQMLRKKEPHRTDMRHVGFVLRDELYAAIRARKTSVMGYNAQGQPIHMELRPAVYRLLEPYVDMLYVLVPNGQALQGAEKILCF